ncbi:Rieske (2Fe-2S) protein [Gulosibacter faecalis]|uniref:Cytochrome bc1 complex Rieske iron-sulfur subunit n=1 Tax=Gulosibacter faecalis TaxID=272240 RepID=A0ABW5UZD4_9MICO|nr:Rieske (2Fe-2S) protein [Gulosibacter faecalis]
MTAATDQGPLLTRRALVRTTAVAGSSAAVAALLSSCTLERTEPAPSPEPFTVPAAEVPVGGGIVLAQYSALVTQPTAGEYRAFSAVCTHQGCVLADVQDRGAHCGCHNSYFDIATGDPVAGPARDPLPELTVTVQGDDLSVS